MANSIEYAKLFQDALDEVLEQNLTTGWAEANASRVKYNGGNELKIAKIELDDLADYDRAGGYADGSVTLEWETHKFRHDRGRKFLIDDMDVDETNFVATASTILGEFVRTKVVPEIDTIRIQELIAKAGHEADVDATQENALEEFKKGIAAIRDSGYDGDLVAHVTYEFLNLLELRMANQLASVTFNVNGVDTQFPSVDGVALIPTVSGRMGDAHFVIAGRTVPLGIVKHAPARVFTPDQNMDADGYVINYRVYHDLFVEDNKVGAIYVAKKPVEGGGTGE